jgi:hypothetical protein
MALTYCFLGVVAAVRRENRPANCGTWASAPLKACPSLFKRKFELQLEEAIRIWDIEHARSVNERLLDEMKRGRKRML